MLSRTLKMAFWVTYDHLGKLILANLMWSLAMLVPGMIAFTAVTTGDRAVAVLIGIPAAIVAFGIVLPVMTAGLAHMVKELIDTRDGSVRDFFTGVRLYGRRAIGIGLVYVFATSSLVVSVWFYSAKLRESVPWLGYGISALALWCLAFACLTAMLVIPALVQKKGSVRETLKLTALLVLDNPMFCLGLAVQFLILIAISLMPPVFVFVSGALMAALTSSAYEMLARKYAARAETPAAAEGGSLRTLTKPAANADDEDDYLNRGLRDFLFPWKG